MLNFEDDIKNCLKVLNEGGIILYPTDTVWGLGCDATNEKAVAKIFALKKRAETKSMIILLKDKNDIEQFSKRPSTSILEMLENTERPITIIYPNAKNIATNLISEDGTIAIRIVKDLFCETLLQSFGKPIVSTSANISGEIGATSFNTISATIKNGADYIVQHRQLENIIVKPSRILLWKNDEEIVVIRD
jgi:L-threonylcarbamoyladenylate synthase